MSVFERRFVGFTAEERIGLVRELEDDAKIGSKSILTGPELEELLTLLAADHFRRARRLRLKRLARHRPEFEEKVRNLHAAVQALAEECLRVLEGGAEREVGELLTMMDELEVLQPAVWYKTYRAVKEESLACALELEADDKGKPFSRP